MKMLSGKFKLFFAVLVFVGDAQRLADQDECIKDGEPGVCKYLRYCDSAIADIKNRRQPQLCGFDGKIPIVCCVDNQPDITTRGPERITTTTRKPVATTTRRSPVTTTTTTEYVPPNYDYISVYEANNVCPPIDPKLTTAKTGQRAWDKCIEYQEKLIYPCETSMSLSEEKVRVNNCGRNADGLIIGGVDAAEMEFPHMVLLGYGSKPKTAHWLCGGSLISDKFILTAGHCTVSREYGNITFVVVGSLRRSMLASRNVYKVRRIVTHPFYTPPNKYDDIALVETEGIIRLGPTVIPACIGNVAWARGEASALGKGQPPPQVVATGWGLTENRGQVADVLQKVTLSHFNESECHIAYPPDRHLKDGIRNTQICYGDRRQKKDTCQGDSGGPLQINNKRIHCMYTIIGVTSFGKVCGFEGLPAVYTNVEPYVGWIENVVWPSIGESFYDT